VPDATKRSPLRQTDFASAAPKVLLLEKTLKSEWLEAMQRQRPNRSADSEKVAEK